MKTSRENLWNHFYNVKFCKNGVKFPGFVRPLLLTRSSVRRVVVVAAARCRFQQVGNIVFSPSKSVEYIDSR